MSGEAATTKEPKTIMGILQSDSMKQQMAMALPKHCTIDRFMRLAITAIRKNPKLAQCTQESVFGCLMDLSQLGIEADGRRAHLIPYGNECTLIIDYKGLAELVMRSNMVSTVHADIVCENDVFEFGYGTGGGLKHIPCLKGDRGKPYGAYSYVKMKDGSESYEFMNEADIMKVKAGSPGAKSKSSPWNHPEHQYEMWKKTPFRRHTKWLPLSPEFRDAVEKDNDEPIDIDVVDHGTEPEPTPKKKIPQVADGKPVTKKKPPATTIKPPAAKEGPDGGSQEPPPDEQKKDDEEKKPAVSGGLTGATQPLGRKGGKKKRTLSNPDE